MATEKSSLVDFYRDNRFNPVSIRVEDEAVWIDHCAKRRNLYENHLRIPLGLLRNKRVLEFGCNSGENALALAAVGARLTLVEPNEQVLPRLHDLFQRFGLRDRVEAVVGCDMETFRSDDDYDLVIAEGFLHTLESRERLLEKLVGFLAPGGLGIISFSDRHGGLIELTKRFVHGRACTLARVDDIFGAASLEISRSLFLEDFRRLKASRSFEAWWKDQIVNPFALRLWSFDEIMPVVEAAGAFFYASSPVWNDVDFFAWYKDVPASRSWNGRLRDEWLETMPFFLTGLPERSAAGRGAAVAVISALDGFSKGLADYLRAFPPLVSPPSLPTAVGQYLRRTDNVEIRRIADEIDLAYAGSPGDGLDEYIARYKRLEALRRCWGTPYHYLCFIRQHGPR